MMIVAFGYEVGAAPFHLAIPDAYSGTSSMVADSLQPPPGDGLRGPDAPPAHIACPRPARLLVRRARRHLGRDHDLGQPGSALQRQPEAGSAYSAWPMRATCWQRSPR